MDAIAEIIEELDSALYAREITLTSSRQAKEKDIEAWEKVQAIIKRLDLPKGRTVVGQWILSKGMDRTGLGDRDMVEVNRVKCLPNAQEP